MARVTISPYLLPFLVILMDGNPHTKDEVIRRVTSVKNLGIKLHKYSTLNNIQKIQAILNEHPPTTPFFEEPGTLSNKDIDSLIRGKLIESAGRGLVKITQRGIALLAINPALIYVTSLGEVTYSKRLNNPVFINFGGITLNIKDVKSR